MSGLRFLLIDDNKSDRALAKHILNRAFGHELQILEVGTADEFARVLEQGEFDFVITDYQLRWNNGIDVLRMIKIRCPECPVVMFTDSGTQEVAVEAMKSGLDDYVVKSSSHYARLPAAVQRALDQAAAKRKSASLETRFQTLLNQLDVGVYRLTTKGDLLEVNPAFLRLIGLPSLTELPENRSLAAYFRANDYDRLMEQLKQTEDIQDQDAQLQRADGSTVWVRLTKRLTITEDNNRITDGIIKDISARKQAEQEREELLARERAARQESDAANRIKDEFLAIVSHELRTPLSAILGWANLLRLRQLNADMAMKAVETIERNARLQNQLIDDILDVSRIVQGKLQITLEPILLTPIVTAVVDAIRPLAASKQIQITTALAPEIEPVMGDSGRLQQVVGNLMSNAVKFTPQGGQIWVELTQRKGQVQLVVRDTGQGIEPDFLPHVFERFRQADSTTTRTQSGLGLGLAIVRSVIELHHGTVAVTSDGRGKGTTFTIQLPAQAPMPVSLPAHSSMSDSFPDLSSIRILVIDDAADNRELIRFILEQCHAQVREADSAETGFALLVQQPPEILISDISMPGEDGYSLLRRIRSLPPDQGRDTLAIALTAYARPEDERDALEAGFQRYLAKPVNPYELVAVVANLANRA